MIAPAMARATDPAESHQHEAAVDKKGLSMRILQRLKAVSPQTYKTLCDFGQPGGPAAYRTLLTQLEREGLVTKVGTFGKAGAFVLTDKGKRVVV